MSSHFYDMGSPLSATETAIFQISLTNTPGATVKDYADYQLVTNSEDIGVVESQRPEEVPLNAAEEIHIPADKFLCAVPPRSGREVRPRRAVDGGLRVDPHIA